MSTKSEDQFQEALERAEQGDNWDISQQNGTDENQALLSLVARLRTAKWPQRDPKIVAAQREQVVKLHTEEPQMDKQNNSLFNFLRDWRLPLAIGAVVITLLVCGLVTMVGIGALFITQQREVVLEQQDTIDTQDREDITQEAEVAGDSEDQAVQSTDQDAVESPERATSAIDALSPNEALLGDLHGLVEIQDGDQWRIIQDEVAIPSSTQLRTGAFSSASLTFKDGSIAQIGPSSEISIKKLTVDPQSSVREVVLVQASGDSAHNVAAMEADQGRYQVRTPSSRGTAQGTQFHLRVTDAQTVWYVDEGKVQVSGEESDVLVADGKMTTVNQDEEPADPAHFFVGQGEVAANGQNWIIGDQTYQTHELTLIIGNPQVGDIVFYEGHLLEDETRVLDLVVLVHRSPANTFTITGAVQAIEDSFWTVNWQDVAVTDLTTYDDDIEVGYLVRVTGVILEDGSLQAEEILLLEGQPGMPFDFTGVVQSMGEQYWSISNISITVNADTVIDEGLIVGDAVQVQGWILEDGTWQADTIIRFLDENSAFEFVGYIDSMDPWVVAGIPFEVSEWAEIDPDLEIDELVRVAGQIQADGTWLAFEVLRYDEALLTILIGRVFSMDPWIVSGITLTVDADTIIVGEITVGMLVRVEMELLPDGSHKVIRIEPLDGFDWAEGCHYIVAKVISVDSDQIQLEGWPALPFGEEVEIEGEVLPGSIVQIMICYDEDMNVVVVYIIAISQPLPPTDGTEDGKVTVCHKPTSKNPHTIVISKSALPAHLGHGDIIGSCP